MSYLESLTNYVFDTSQIRISYYAPAKINHHLKTIVFLHGFSGSALEWGQLTPYLSTKYNLILIDLPGFGLSDHPQIEQLYSPLFVSAVLVNLFNKLNLYKVVLVGYSMGGRYALNFSDIFSYRLLSLVLISSSPGIKEKTEREKRILEDEKLEQFILENTISDFVDFWMNQDLFSNLKKLPKETFDTIRNIKLCNSKEGLISSLRRFGMGKMEPLYDILGEINLPVLLIVGKDDQKYCRINTEMSIMIMDSELVIIPGCTHSVHIEAPYNVAEAMKLFIQ